MSLIKKLKDILFEEEEEYTEPIKVKEEVKKEEPKIVKIEPKKEEISEISKNQTQVASERELFRSENSFTFPDFDEEEFQSNMSRPKEKRELKEPATEIKNRPNVLEYERKKTIEKRTDYGRYERVETREYTEKRKFKPSPIISPVYGILNQDYKAEDIVKKDDEINIDIEAVRKKAFEPKIENEVLQSEEISTETLEDSVSEPVVTFFEEKDKIKIKGEEINDNYKSIDDLLESASSEINLEDTLEIPKTNNLDAIEEELEKLDVNPKEEHDDLDDTLDSDLFELIDSMYDEREEGE